MSEPRRIEEATVPREVRDWLILDPSGRCYWREDGKGYDDVLGAGFYTEERADAIVRLGRGDRKVHISDAGVQAILRHAREGLARWDAVARTAPDGQR